MSNTLDRQSTRDGDGREERQRVSVPSVSCPSAADGNTTQTSFVDSVEGKRTRTWTRTDLVVPCFCAKRARGHGHRLWRGGRRRSGDVFDRVKTIIDCCKFRCSLLLPYRTFVVRVRTMILVHTLTGRAYIIDYKITSSLAMCEAIGFRVHRGPGSGYCSSSHR